MEATHCYICLQEFEKDDIRINRGEGVIACEFCDEVLTNSENRMNPCYYQGEKCNLCGYYFEDNDARYQDGKGNLICSCCDNGVEVEEQEITDPWDVLHDYIS